MKLAEFRAQLPAGDLWVFGYASLMWSPGFRHRERVPAFVYGYHRSLCIYSHRHRGTPERPGLVMGLCRGGSCWGMAFRVKSCDAAAVLRALWHREMRNVVYQPRLMRARVRRDRVVDALSFVADTCHRQFAGDLDVDHTARLVAQGKGGRGHNLDYLRRTLAHMHEIGVRDAHLDRVLERVLRLRAGTRLG